MRFRGADRRISTFLEEKEEAGDGEQGKTTLSCQLIIPHSSAFDILDPERD